MGNVEFILYILLFYALTAAGSCSSQTHFFLVSDAYTVCMSQ